MAEADNVRQQAVFTRVEQVPPEKNAEEE
jgi:hypothetical protein